MNKAVLTGTVINDLEVKETPNKKVYCKLRIEVPRDKLSKNGKQLNDYFTVIAWGAYVDELQENTAKGHKIMVEGRIQSRSYEDANTKEKRYVTEIIAEGFDYFKELNSSFISSVDDDEIPF